VNCATIKTDAAGHDIAARRADRYDAAGLPRMMPMALSQAHINGHNVNVVVNWPSLTAAAERQ